MDRQSVVSSNLNSVGYDEESQVLEIEFSNGSVYEYSGVPASVYEELMSASSHGSYHYNNIRNTYNYNRIG